MCNIFDGCFNLFLLICVELAHVSSLPADDRMNPLQKLTEFKNSLKFQTDIDEGIRD